jgi:hypothetical protein
MLLKLQLRYYIPSEVLDCWSFQVIYVRAFGNFRIYPEIQPPDLGNIRNIFPDSAEFDLGNKNLRDLKPKNQ